MSKHKSAWRPDAEHAAPRDRQILFRHADWFCPAIIEYKYAKHGNFWAFSEPVLLDIAGAVSADQINTGEWCEIPQ